MIGIARRGWSWRDGSLAIAAVIGRTKLALSLNPLQDKPTVCDNSDLLCHHPFALFEWRKSSVKPLA